MGRRKWKYDNTAVIVASCDASVRRCDRRRNSEILRAQNDSRKIRARTGR